MIELLKILLSLSLSGALLILVLLLCKPLYKNRLSRQFQYYIWLIVIARLLLPFTPETSLVGNLFQEVDSAIVQISTNGPADSRLSSETDFMPPKNQANTTAMQSPQLDKTLVQKMLDTAAQNVWLICVLVWLMVAVGLLIRKVTIYQSFVKYINAGRMEVTDMKLWEQLGKLVEQARVKRTVELYTNSLISSPLLIGFLHPCIMLPSAELSDSDLKNTILHELTHYKRRDMFYKWLVQVSICFHWFNPFVYLMGKEINRACEFSCDEAVIRTFDKGAQQAYGDTLLNALNLGGHYKDSLASVTLNENTEILKERLDAIMDFKKKSRLCIAISITFIFVMCFGATAAGAYTKPDSKTQTNSINTHSNETNVKIDIDQLNQSEQISYGPYSLKAGTVWGANLSWNGNGMISVSCKSNVKYAGEQLRQQVESPITYEFTIQEDGEYTFIITNQYAVSQEYKLEPFVTNLTGLIYMGNKPSKSPLQQSKPVDNDEMTDVKSKSNNESIEMETLKIGDKIYYWVENETQLRSIGQGKYSLDKNYIQAADIHMSANEWTPIGAKDKPFTGSYCGNGYEIIGLTMTDPNAKIIGLFGVADGANIYNITMRDYNIQAAGRNVTGKSIAPILALGLGNTRSYDNQVYPKKLYTYSQTGYYQGAYIFELGWNLNDKGYNAYVDKTKLTLSDLTTITVSFDKSCKEDLQDKEMLADLKALVERLKEQHSNSTNPLKRPLVVSVDYIGGNELVKLAEEYYSNGKLTRFSAIFSALNENVQKEYCKKMIEDEKLTFLSSTAKNMESDMLNFCLEQTYQKEKLTLFSCIVPYFSTLNEDVQKEYCKKMIKDGKLTFLSSTAKNMESDMLDFCLEQTYQKGKLTLFSCIVPYITDNQRQTWVTRTSQDNKITYLFVLTEKR